MSKCTSNTPSAEIERIERAAVFKHFSDVLRYKQCLANGKSRVLLVDPGEGGTLFAKFVQDEMMEWSLKFFLFLCVMYILCGKDYKFSIDREFIWV